MDFRCSAAALGQRPLSKPHMLRAYVQFRRRWNKEIRAERFIAAGWRVCARPIGRAVRIERQLERAQAAPRKKNRLKL